MKNQIILTISIVSMFVLAIATSGQAAFCPSADIITVEVEDQAPSANASQYNLTVVCTGKFSARNFYLSANLGDSAYATVLTAISLTKPIYIEMADYNAGSLVLSLRLAQ